MASICCHFSSLPPNFIGSSGCLLSSGSFWKAPGVVVRASPTVDQSSSNFVKRMEQAWVICQISKFPLFLEEKENVGGEEGVQSEQLTRNAAQVQRDTLKKILEQNGEAEYLQSLGLNGRTDAESFKGCVPIVTHKDVEPYIRRIVDGD